MTVTNYLKFFILTLMCLLIGASGVFAATVYVDVANEGGTEDGTSWATAWGTIQEGVDDPNFSGGTGNTVLVASGTYNEQVNLDDAHDGASGSLNAIVSSGTVVVDGNSYCFYLYDADYIKIEGFRLTGATSYGTYLYSYSSSNIIEGCVIYGNGADGIRLYLGSNNIIKDCVIYGNGADGIWMYYSCDNNVIERCVIYGNGAGGVFVERYSNSNLIENCVVYDSGSYGVYSYNNSDVTVKNSIVVYNTNYGFRTGGDNSNITSNYNDVYANGTNYSGTCSPGSNSISENPGFLNPYNSDFHLYSDSPCVGTGESGVDMGIYPSGPTTPISSATYYVSTTGNDNDDGSEAFPWEHIQHAADTMLAGDTVIMKSGTYTEDVLITWGGTESSPITYTSSGTVIVDGINYGFKLNEVAGVHIEEIEFTGSNKGIFLEDAYANTISSCTIHDNSGMGIHLIHSNKNEIIGSEIYSNSSSGIYFAVSKKNTIQDCNIYQNWDGIVLNSSNTNNVIKTCYVHENNVSGICMYSSSNYNEVQNCDISSNVTIGIYLSSSRYNTIEYCSIYKNGDDGIYASGSSIDITIESCVVYDNDSDGIYVYDNSVSTVKNSIILNNTTYGLRADGTSTITATYNDVYNNKTNYSGCSAGAGSISVIPGFVNPYNGDFHLYSDSPCVGTGESGVDMGVYPSGPTTTVSSATYYVSTTGNDNDDGSEAFPWEHIQHAADTMLAGDTVIMKPGTYAEDVLITRGGTPSSPVTYRSSGTAVVDGVNYCFKLDDVAVVHIEEIEFTGSDKGILLEDTYDNTISSCSIHDNTGRGMELLGCENNNFIGNDIYSNGSYGIYFYESKSNTIQDCDISSNTSVGVYLNDYSTDNQIKTSRIYQNDSYGIYMYVNSDYNKVQDCDIYLNGSIGIYLNDESRYNTIENCDIYSNVSSGIYIRNSSMYNIIENCNIYSNGGAGVYFYSSTISNNIKYCNIYGNGGAGIDAFYTYAGSNTMESCVVYDNDTYGIYIHSYSNFIVKNSIIAFNNTYGLYAYNNSTITATYNDVYSNGTNYDGCSPGAGSISDTPGFVDPYNGDFHLYSDSPCVDAGDPAGTDMGSYPGGPTTPPSSNTYYVSTTGNDNDDGSEAFPWEHIQHAADTMLAGDTVIVLPGTYNEEVSVVNGGTSNSPITYRSSGTVVVDGNIHCFKLDSVDWIIIEGFELTGAANNGIYSEYSCNNTIDNCNIHDNGTYGVYLKNYSSNNTLQYCNVYSNVSDGIYLYNGNDSNNIKYCNIYRNGGTGIYGRRYSDNTIESCVVYDNDSYGIRAYDNVSLTVKNSIIVNNTTYGLRAESGCTIDATYNDVYNNGTDYDGCGPGAGSISVNPGFVDPYNDDFHLYSNASCVDAGTPAGTDIGVYPTGPTTPPSSNTYYVSTTGNDSDDGSQAFPWEHIQHAADTMIAGDTVIVLPGTYFEEVSIVKGGTYGSPITYRSSGTIVVDGNIRCFKLDSVARIVIEGFEMTSATNEGIYLQSSCDITIHGCNIYNNGARGVSLANNSDNNTIQYCNVYRNGSDGIYGYDNCSSNKIYDCVVYDNNSYGIYANSYTSFTVNNSIVSSNSTYGLRAFDNSTITDDYNDVYNNGTNYDGCAPGGNSVSQDPLFVSTISGIEDFHLKSGSPCIGTGKPNPSLKECMGSYDIYNTLTDDYAGAMTTHKITFTTGKTNFGTSGSIPSDGRIEITYPSGFDLTGVSSSGASNTMDGSFSVNVSAQVVTITRSGGTTTTSGQTEDISIIDVINHNTMADYTIFWESQDGSGSTIEGPLKSNNFEVFQDTIAPAAVTDLTATPCATSGGAVDLTWTAPKEDGSAGDAVTSYDVRYASITFTDANWDASWVYQATGEPSSPKTPGETESFTAGGLSTGTVYYFAIKSIDDEDNISAIDTKTASLNQANAEASDDTPTPPVVTVIYPNGGGTCSGTETISWTYSDYNTTDTHTFDIELSTNGGNDYSIIISSELPDGTTSYLWNTKLHYNGDNYKIKVIATDSGSLSGEDESDEIFNISNPNEKPVVTIQYPQQDNVLGGTNNIQWTCTDPNAKDTHTFEMLISLNGGASWKWFVDVKAGFLVENGTSYEYPLNTKLCQDGKSYRIKVIATDNIGEQGEGLSGIFEIYNNNKTSSSFSLLSPANRSFQPIFEPTFDWEDSVVPDGNNITYSLWYSKKSNFTPHTEISGIDVSEWKPSTKLNDEIIYYWKVKAEDDYGLSWWANETNWYFTMSRTRITSDDGCVYVVIHSGLPDNGYVNVNKKTVSNSSSLFLAHQETRSNPLLKSTSGNGYEINICNDNNNNILSGLNISATITMYYDDADDNGFLDGTKIQEKYMRIFRLNEDEKRWELVDSEQTRNETNNSVSVDVSHFSTYALFAYVRPTGILCKASNYPNPFDAGEESTTISYILTKDSKVTIKIYNLVGDLVRKMEFDAREEGGTGEKYGYNNRIVWDGRNGDSMKVANGAYICQIIAEPEDGSGQQEELRKIGVLK